MKNENNRQEADAHASELSDLLAVDNTPVIEKIRDLLIQAAGQNVLFSDSKQTASLIKCAYYLATQVQIIDDSDKKEISLSILGNALNILRASYDELTRRTIAPLE